MGLGERKLLTWTLNAGTTAYETDLDQYGHKIYALGVHEFQVEYDGEIYVRRAIPSTYDGSNYGDYRYGSNNQNFIDNAVPSKNPDGRAWMSWSFWQSIERGMRRWEHIRHYPSFILFGASRVTRMLDTKAYQDAFIDNCKLVIDNLMSAYNYPGTSNKPYIKGIEIDFEASMSDSSLNYRLGDNIKYMNILKRVKNEICIPRGLILQVNAYAMWGKDTPYYYRFHDYEMFAKETDSNGNSVIDELQIMTYDFAWNGSAPGASTPLWWFDNVAAWAKETFGAPGAKLTLNNVFFGSAGYGHRWGIYDYDFMYGSTITYRQFVDWQNGLYKHYRPNPDIPGSIIYNDQEFLRFAGIEDQESKNQILQQHIYDYFKARYGVISTNNGADSAVISSYNGGEYATTYSRIQRSEFSGIVAETFAPSSTSGASDKLVTTSSDIVNTPISIKEDGVERTKTGIMGYKPYGKKWIPVTEDGVGTYCKLLPSGKITYTLNVPNAGKYRLIALVSFVWYSQSKIGGTFNGNHLTIEPFADYYPLMFKASHWFDCGEKDFKAGANTIIIDGDLSHDGTIIYGFIACEDFKNNYAGGEITFKANVKPFKKKNGEMASVPPRLSVTSKALRQDPLPLMMWEDRFSHYRRATDPDTGEVFYQDVPDITAISSYYTSYQKKNYQGNGNTLSNDRTYCYDPNEPTYEIGYSTGVWAIKQSQLNGLDDDAYAYWGDTSGEGKLLVNYNFISNMQIEAEVRVIKEGTVGLYFGGSTNKNGYLFLADYKNRMIKLVKDGVTIQQESLPASYALGARTKLKVIIHNGKGYFYFGFSDVKAFGGSIFDLSDRAGGVAGVYANSVEARFYMMKISTTDKWDLMEKFTVEATVKGQKYSNTFGKISRSKYTIDPNFGYLNYSGINELETRDSLPTNPTDPDTEYVREDVSLDYEFFITDIPGVEGAVDIKVIFDDPGIWYGYLYIVDRVGGSITWVGDSHSFLDTLNRASNEVGAKGIGMWTMGQEEPRVFDTIPEIVPYHDPPSGL